MLTNSATFSPHWLSLHICIYTLQSNAAANNNAVRADFSQTCCCANPIKTQQGRIKKLPLASDGKPINTFIVKPPCDIKCCPLEFLLFLTCEGGCRLQYYCCKTMLSYISSRLDLDSGQTSLDLTQRYCVRFWLGLESVQRIIHVTPQSWFTAAHSLAQLISTCVGRAVLNVSADEDAPEQDAAADMQCDKESHPTLFEGAQKRKTTGTSRRVGRGGKQDQTRRHIRYNKKGREKKEEETNSMNIHSGKSLRRQSNNSQTKKSKKKKLILTGKRKYKDCE